jgi:hypothetical protein
MSNCDHRRRRKRRLLKSKVCGKMYKWISHFLTNKTAQVHLQGHLSKNGPIQQGVPQGGVLSPTLFLLYINDITENNRRRVHNSFYADDLAYGSPRITSQLPACKCKTHLQALKTGLANGYSKLMRKNPCIQPLHCLTKNKWSNSS